MIELYALFWLLSTMTSWWYLKTKEKVQYSEMERRIWREVKKKAGMNNLFIKVSLEEKYFAEMNEKIVTEGDCREKSKV